MTESWTGLPNNVLYQGASGGLDGREPAAAHCGPRVMQSLRRNRDVGTMMRRALVVPREMARSLNSIYGYDQVVEGEYCTPFTFTFKKGKRRRFAILPQGLGFREVDALRSRARESHVYTQGSSILDTQHRRSHELANDLVHCGTRVPDDILERIRAGIFPHVAVVRPRFEKIVMYGEGGFVDLHQDAALWDTHVGTLLFIPDMPYTGGQLIVDNRSRGGRGSCFVAFPCSTTHGVSKVISGRRVAIVFSLWTKGLVNPGIIMRQHKAELSLSIAQTLRKQPDDCSALGAPTVAVIRLSGQYTLEHITEKGKPRLNGVDSAVYACVREMCFQQPLVLPVHVGTYGVSLGAHGYENQIHCWVSRYTHFDVGCACDKEDDEVPHPNLIDPSKALLVGFDDVGHLVPTGSTPFYDMGTSLSAYRACAIAFSTEALCRGERLRNFLLASFAAPYQGKDNILVQLRTKLRDIWILLGKEYV